MGVHKVAILEKDAVLGGLEHGPEPLLALGKLRGSPPDAMLQFVVSPLQSLLGFLALRDVTMDHDAFRHGAVPVEQYGSFQLNVQELSVFGAPLRFEKHRLALERSLPRVEGPPLLFQRHKVYRPSEELFP